MGRPVTQGHDTSASARKRKNTTVVVPASAARTLGIRRAMTFTFLILFIYCSHTSSINVQLEYYSRALHFEQLIHKRIRVNLSKVMSGDLIASLQQRWNSQHKRKATNVRHTVDATPLKSLEHLLIPT